MRHFNYKLRHSETCVRQESTWMGVETRLEYVNTGAHASNESEVRSAACVCVISRPQVATVHTRILSH